MSELYELPNGWEWKTLLDVCTFINGRAYKKDELLSSGKYPVLRVGNFFTNNNWYYSDLELPNNKYCDYGDLLYAWSASFGPQIWKGNKSIYHYHIWKLIPNKELITKEFLYQMLDWDVDKIKADQGTGATMIHITKGSIESRIVPIPPLSEQQRIVSKLDLLFEKIDKSIALHQKNMDEANAFMGSVLNDVFGELEEKYEKTIIKNILKIAQYGFSTKSSDNGKYPFLRMGDLQNGKILLNNLKYVNLSDKEFLKYKLEKYDILFNRTNSFELVGKTSIFEESIDMSFASYLVRLRVDDNKAYPYYLNYYLNAEKTQSLLKEMATKAVNQSNINAQKLQSILIPLPPLNIQQKVVKYLDEITQKIEKIKQAQKDKMNSLKALKASILDQAFKGEL